MLEEFKNWLKLQALEERTISSYIHILKNFLLYSHHELNQEILNNYFLNRMDKIKPNTYNVEKYALTKYCEFKNVDLIIPKRRKVDYVSPLVKGYMTLDDFENDLLRNLNYMFNTDKVEKYELLFKMMFFTGMRAEEIENLKKEDIDFKNGLINIRNTKNKTDREIFFTNKNFEALLQKWVENLQGDSIFNLSYTQIRYATKVVKENLSLKYTFTPHTFRRSFCMYCLSNKIDIATVAKMIGHSNLDTIKQYAEPDQNMVKEACSKLREGK